MGEIAEMILDGTMCQVCGVWMNDGEDGPGHPQTCEGCAEPPARPNKKNPSKDIQCRKCAKWFASEFSLFQHMRDRHPGVFG